jgi:hypothetical protein
MKVHENPLRNVLREAQFLSKGWYWWLMKGMMKSLEVLKATINSSQNVCLGLFVYGFCWLAFHEKVPWFLGTSKNYNNPLKLWVQSNKGGLWFFVRLFKAVIWGSGYVLSSCFYALSNGAMVLRTLDYVICVGWAKGFMSLYVNGNLSSRGCPMWSWVCVVWRLWEDERRPVGSRERDQSNLTP